MLEMEVRHNGLNKFRMIRGTDRWVVEEKARVQNATWDEQWQRKSSANQKQAFLYNLKGEAANRTAIAEKVRETLNALLSSAVHAKVVSWNTMKLNPPFNKKLPTPITPRQYAEQPDQTIPTFVVQKTFFERLFPSLAKVKLEEADALTDQAKVRLEGAMRTWQNDCLAIDKHNAIQKTEYLTSTAVWQTQKSQHRDRIISNHAIIDERARKYGTGDTNSVVDFLDLVLSESKYPDFFPDDWDIEYQSHTKTAIIEFRLPSLDDIPNLKESKFIASRNVIDDVLLKPTALNALYDSTVYQICLRTLYEIFVSDDANLIDFAVFNGWVQYIDRSSGHETRACIMSVHTSKETFDAINLAAIDPKACFRSLKGVGSSQLHAMAAIAPILKLNREDKRFIASVDVESSLDQGVNLAAITWQDFEYLIRQVFEREFSSTGGEVKVTQASRDGGVDAIAFDPDPIRGGKIVIQAKRYTNTVGVSAVRDLYGTMMNEGATKGILVTTSSYGPDAYSFAKNKPLTLLDGSNLLHLMGKHGHNVRIDLAEAKRMAQ